MISRADEEVANTRTLEINSHKVSSLRVSHYPGPSQHNYTSLGGFFGKLSYALPVFLAFTSLGINLVTYSDVTKDRSQACMKKQIHNVFGPAV